MSYFDRFDVCEAYYMFATLYQPTRTHRDTWRKLSRLKFRPSPLLRLESMSENAKEIFGQLVREELGVFLGFERLYKRRPDIAGSWPGSYNIHGGDVRAYLKSRGILEACEALS